MVSGTAFSSNLILSAMDAADLYRLKPYFERVSLKLGLTLADAGKPVRAIYFPEGGIVSAVSNTPDQGPTEIGIIGREGFTGTGVFLGADISPYKSFVQLNSSTALRIPIEPIRAVFDDSRAVRSLILRFIHCFSVQVAHSSVSNARQNMEARLSRWLLMCHDRIDGDEIVLTHEFMAVMIAAQRTGVTVTLHVLEGMGAIRSTRGKVTIADRTILEDIAGTAYGETEAEYSRLISGFGKS